MAIVNVVAREVGNSLDQLYLADRLRELAIREDRIRLARDLHDGVLQSLTGVRLELQAIAAQPVGELPIEDRLLAIERALALEQRELRLFIEDLRPPAAAGRRRIAGAAARRDVGPPRGRVEGPDRGARHAAGAVAAGCDRAGRAADGARGRGQRAQARHPSKVTVDVAARDGAVDRRARRWAWVSTAGRLDHDELVRRNVGPASLRDRVIALGGRMAIESTASGSRIEIAVPAERPSRRHSAPAYTNPFRCAQSTSSSRPPISSFS
jgi:hypothetical protein